MPPAAWHIHGLSRALHPAQPKILSLGLDPCHAEQLLGFEVSQSCFMHRNGANIAGGSGGREEGGRRGGGAEEGGRV